MRMNPIVVGHDDISASSASAARIDDDRALLRHLRINDSDAAMFLGRSRQTLIIKLGPKKGAKHPPPSNYFKLTDIVILVSAARQMGRNIDPETIRIYVDSTRKPAEGLSDERYAMLIGLLSGSSERISLAGAETVVFVMPAFAELRAHRLEVARDLKRRIKEDIGGMEPPPTVYLLAPTNLQARAAGQWLGIDAGHCYGSEVIEYYLPSILVYRDLMEEPSPYVLTEDGEFVAAPRFMNHMVADCVRSLLPADVGQKLLPTDKRRRAAGGD